MEPITIADIQNTYAMYGGEVNDSDKIMLSAGFFLLLLIASFVSGYLKDKSVDTKQKLKNGGTAAGYATAAMILVSLIIMILYMIFSSQTASVTLFFSGFGDVLILLGKVVGGLISLIR